LVLADGYKVNSKIDTKKISRNHVIEVSDSGLVSVMGGKWTIFRVMAEETVDGIFKILQSRGENRAFKPSISSYVRLVGDFDRNEQKPL
jgi:glycerol-3-phosphate dehydrogenase